MAGKVTGEFENPLPLVETEFTVTGAVPLEVRVTVCVIEPFTTTPPNATLVALRLKVGVAAFNCSEIDVDVLPALAVRVTDWAVVTEAAFAVKVALLAVAGTKTELGTVTAPLLLARVTLTPPVGAEPERLTEHASASVPVIDVLLQLTPLTVGVTLVPVPLRLTEALGAVLDIVSWPLDEVALAGSN